MSKDEKQKGNGADNSKDKREDLSSIKYPCKFPIKVMGKKDSDVKAKALSIIQKHCPEFKGEPKERLSRDNNYVSLTFAVMAKSKEQLDAIYSELTQCDDVLMAL